MFRYLFGRVLQSIISVLALVTIVFLASRLIGDPTTSLLPMDATKEDVASLKSAYGLDKSLLEQYAVFLQKGITGDLGNAFYWRRPVTELLWSRLGPSLELMAAAMAVALLISIVPGLYAAVGRGGRFDLFARAFAVLGGSMPSFWTGLMSIWVFTVWLQIIPSIGRQEPLSIVLPATILGWTVSGGILRLTRSSMLDVLGREYVKLARIKGVPEWQVLWKHAFKNAMLPVVTYAASIAARLLGAAIVVETVFAWPGLGRLLIQAVAARDFPVIQGVVFLIGAFMIITNLMVDILYAYLNPRIRYS